MYEILDTTVQVYYHLILLTELVFVGVEDFEDGTL